MPAKPADQEPHSETEKMFKMAIRKLAHSALDRFFVALFRRRPATDFHPSKRTKFAKFTAFTGHRPTSNRSTLTGAKPPQNPHSQCKNVRQTMPQKLAHTTLLLLRRVFFSRSEAKRPGCVRWQLPRRSSCAHNTLPHREREKKKVAAERFHEGFSNWRCCCEGVLLTESRV